MNIVEMTTRIIDLCKVADFCDNGEYEWELGVNIVNTLRASCDIYVQPKIDVFDERITMYGVLVRINYDNPNKIKLWKSVDGHYDCQA